MRNTGCNSIRQYAESGVDLNRNYAYQWGIDENGSSSDPCDECYRGEKPFSEPEI